MSTFQGEPGPARMAGSRNELGDFLRSRREKLVPDCLVPGNGRRRRTPGLRREEVAERAGIGIDWYVRLEQGRAVSPSATTIDALAEALRLGKVEHAHLRALARHPGRPAFSRETVPGGLRRLVETLNHPAYITGRRWDLLAWNDAAAEFLDDFNGIAEPDRNILLQMMTAPEMRNLFGEAWPREARRMLALFRATYDFWAGDPSFDDLLGRLRQGCPECERWWDSHDIGSSEGVRKLLHHPTRGVLQFQTASFQANEDASLKLTVYIPLPSKLETWTGLDVDS